MRLADRVVLEAAAPDDCVEVTLEGGVQAVPAGAGGGRAARRRRAVARVEPGTVPLASAPGVGDGTRGVAEWAIEGLRLIGVDLAGKAAAEVAACHRRAPGADARAVPMGRHPAGPMAGPIPDGGQPWLLFLHGTFSNTLGSFGALAAQSALWRRLEATYPNRILALEHRTLTTSPIENAAAVAALLPAGVELHMVGYSRGGLVGELLCRGKLDGRDAFDAAEIKLFEQAGQRAALMALGADLDRAQPSVDRFVRVGCPARGTTLASGRLDRWLNFVLGALGHGMGAIASPLAGETYDLVTAFLLAVIKQRADAATIPGLEAMIPGSPLIKLLNRPGVTAATDLAVLKGDIEGAGILGRLKVLATDLFFREDHDLVVNTTAMDGGMARSPRARAFFDQGPEVSHFAYFGNPRTAERVVDGLLRADGADGGFVVPSEPVPLPPTIGVGRGTAKRPVVFVLPGITGSTLSGNFNGLVREIWVDLPQLAAEGSAISRSTSPGSSRRSPCRSITAPSAASSARPTKSVPGASTGDARSWTPPSCSRPHSAPRWRAPTSRCGSLRTRWAGWSPAAPCRTPSCGSGSRSGRARRLIQLGTPNGGSWSIPFMLMGRNELMGFLERIDFTMNRREQQDVIVRFPGALQMLPHGEPTLFDAARWQALSQFDPGDEGWATPRAADLAIAASFRDQFASAPLDPERMFYVAGQAPTLVGIEQDPNAPAGQRIRFRIGAEGDGQVPWTTGIPPGIRAWYTDAEHGDLARHEPAFAAIQELLEQGTTRLLPDHPPVVSRGRGVPREQVARPGARMFPDAEDLMLSGMGGTRRAPEAGRPPRIRIKVVHGHLAFATPSGAGRPLCRRHDQRRRAGARRGARRPALARRKQLGLYPGALGTSTVVARSPPQADGRDRGRPGRSCRPRARHARRDAAARDSGLRDRGRRRDVRRAAGDAEPRLGVHGAAGRRGRRRPAASPAVSRRCSAPRWRPSACSARTGSRELEVLELVEDRANRAWHVLARPCRAASSRGLRARPCGQGRPWRPAATSPARATRAGGSRSRSPWRRSAASG